MKFDYIKLAKLVKKVKSGDSDAFEKLYILTHKKIYIFSLSIVKDVDLAEDIVQDVFLTIKEKIHTLENPKLFIAWINKITYNKCINEINKEKKHIFSTNYDVYLEDIKDLDTCINPESKYETKEKTNYIISLIDKLSDTHKTLILLKYYSGLKNDEIASIMNIPVGTVKSGLHYAKKKLRSLYDKKLYGVLFIPNIHVILDDYYNKNLINSDISKGILKYNYEQKLKRTSLFKKILVAGSFSISIPFLLLVNINPSIKSIDYGIENAKYINSDIDVKIYVNQHLFLKEIYITDQNNNKMKLNKLEKNIFSINIKNNGDYKIHLSSYTNKEICKNMNINFIDKVAPKISNFKYNDKEIVITLEDNLSQIDYDNIEIKDSKGNILEIKEKNIDNDEIILNIPNSNLQLYLSDYAGNKRVYLISKKYI